MKKLYILTIIVALFGISQAWANTATITGSDFKTGANKGNSTTQVWSGPHANFTLTGTDIGHTDAAGTEHITFKKNNLYTITWTLPEEGYDISVTSVEFTFGNPSIFSYDVEISGSKVESIGTWATNAKRSMDFSPALGKDGSITVKTTGSGDTYRIVVTYTITPNVKPSVAVSEPQELNVTIDPEHKQTIDLKSLFTLPAGVPEDFEFGYQANGGTIDGVNFYATAAGTYTVKAQIAAKADHHEASAWSEVATITVNRLDQTLSWVDEEAIETSIVIEDTKTIAAVSTSGRAVSYISSNESVLSVDAEGKLTALAVGEATVIATCAQDDQYNAAEPIEKTFQVIRKTPAFLPVDFVAEDSCAVRNGETATIELNNVSDGLNGDFTAVASNDKISVSREGNVLTIHTSEIGEATLTLSQNQTDMLAELSKTYKVKVLGLPNAILVNGEADYAGEVQLESSLLINFASDNTDENAPEFIVEQLSGAEIATYENGAVIANYHVGTATWKVSQAESGNYDAAEAIFSVTVKPSGEGVTCYVLEDDELIEWATVGRTKEYAVNGPAAQLKFQARRVALLGFSTNGDFFAEYSTTEDTDDWNRLEPYMDLPEAGKDKWYTFTYDIPEDTKRVRMRSQTGAQGYRCIQNVRVTRKTYLRAEDVALELFPQEDGEGVLTVDYSLADGNELKIICDNELFTLNQNTIAYENCTSGKVEIPFTFAAQEEQKTYTANVTIYNAVYTKTVKLSANVRKLNPVITWEDIELVYGDQAALEATVDIDELALNYALVDETDVIRIEEGKIFATKAGTAQVKAFTEETIRYNAAEKTITVTVNKAPQTILWAQELTELEISKDLQLAATATSELEVVFESSDPEIAYIGEGNVLYALAEGEVTITAKQAGNDNYEAAEPIEKKLAITKLAQEIVWGIEGDTIKIAVNAEHLLMVTATSGLEVELESSDPEVVAVLGSSYGEETEFLGFVLQALAEGEATITASQPGNEIFAAAEQSLKIVVVLSEPTGLENLNETQLTVKLIRNGQVFILRDGKLYNIQGMRVE